MKKIASLLLVFIMMFAVAIPTFAASTSGEELIDLYPERGPGDTRYNLSNWSIDIGAYRLHFARQHAKFLSTLAEGSLVNGVVDTTDPLTKDKLFTYEYGSIGGIIMNDTDETIKILGSKTSNDRVSMMSGGNRVMVFFDKDGLPYMYENTTANQKLVRTGEGLTATFRLATAEEIEADAAKPTAEQTLITTPVRYKKNVNNPAGFDVEPITFTKVISPDLEVGQSRLVDYDPRDLVLAPGEFMLAFGAIERRAENKFHNEFIDKVLLEYVKGINVATVPTLLYQAEDAMINIPAGFDMDPATPALDLVVAHNAEFKLDELLAGVNATWMHMFDADGNKIFANKKIDFKAELYNYEDLLETVNFKYDAETDSYTADGNFTKVDTSEFGSAFDIKISAVNGEGNESAKNVALAIGVIPPRFTGIISRAANEGEYVDLLSGIKAVDGEGNDMTSEVKVTVPAGFSQYAPKPGVYTISLEVEYIYEEINPETLEVIATHKIIAPASYKLTIDDVTAPEIVVVNDNYTITTDQFTDVKSAVLANIVAIDNVKTQGNLAYVVDGKKVDLTTPGTYTASVTAVDFAGNETTVEFKVTVIEAKATVGQVNDLAIEVDKGVSVVATILISLGMSALSFGGAFLLISKKKQ